MGEIISPYVGIKKARSIVSIRSFGFFYAVIFKFLFFVSRVNFILKPWALPRDAVLCSGRGLAKHPARLACKQPQATLHCRPTQSGEPRDAGLFYAGIRRYLREGAKIKIRPGGSMIDNAMNEILSEYFHYLNNSHKWAKSFRHMWE